MVVSIIVATTPTCGGRLVVKHGDHRKVFLRALSQDPVVYFGGEIKTMDGALTQRDWLCST